MNWPRLLLTWILLLTAWLSAGQARAAPELALRDHQPRVAAWAALRVLADPDGALQAAQALQRLDRFQPPQGPPGNLGPSRGPVWLYLPLRAVDGDGRWVMDIDYPSLHRVEVTLLREGRSVMHTVLGTSVGFEQRQLHSRSLAVALDLAPGASHALLMRVQTDSALILPISLSKPDAFYRAEASAQLLQGVLAGVALALLAYSLAHWFTLRERMFLQYALMLAGVTTFFTVYFGIGQQHLWNEQTGLLAKAAPLGVLVALAAGSLFVTSALRTREHATWVHRGLLGVGAVAALGLVASVLGLLGYRSTQVLATALGPLPMLLAIPEAYRQHRSGDRVASFMLLGWCAYMVGALTMVGLLRGHLAVGFWSQHMFQFTSLVEMMAWTQVLSLRIEAIRRGAERLVVEKQAMESLAHTDALTGLPNRRGLQRQLALALTGCRQDHALAVYLLDLDGFKPVNDRWGHDAGDELLVQVARRLREPLRQGDLVARLGGDEFVLMAPGIGDEADAMTLGRKLLQAFDQPFTVAGHPCRVGLTIGFALAPQDGQHADDLLQRADAAMYAGKQAGRHTVRRGSAAASPLPGLSAGGSFSS